MTCAWTYRANPTWLAIISLTVISSVVNGSPVRAVRVELERLGEIGSCFNVNNEFVWDESERETNGERRNERC